MKKKELLKMPKLKPTEYMHRTAMAQNLECILYEREHKRDIRKEYPKHFTRYYKAVVQDGILKVAMWDWHTIIMGGKSAKPDYEIYCDKKNDKWMNYNPRTEKWGEARIENLDFTRSGCTYGDWYGVQGYSSEESRKIVAQYLERQQNNFTVRTSILNWQKEIAQDRLIYTHRKELEYIDSYMALVPDLPKDFEKWVVDEACADAKYIIFNRQTGIGECFNCSAKVPITSKFKHNEEGRCPECKCKITYKSWFKQKYLVCRKRVGIIQELTDKSGYMLREMDITLQQKRDLNYELQYYYGESYRFLLGRNFGKLDTFEWGEYKNTGIRRWCHELNHGMGWYGVSEECVLYPRNLTKMLKDTELKYMPVLKLLKRNPMSYVRPSMMMRELCYQPEVEMMIKVGLYRAALDRVTMAYDRKQWNRESPWNYFEISKEYFEMAVKNNASMRRLETMKSLTKTGTRLNYEDVCWMSKYFYTDTAKVTQLGHTEKLIRYIQELEEKKRSRAASDYMDYIDDLNVLGIPKTKNVLFPMNFDREHEELSELRREHEKKLENMELREKNRELRKMLPNIRKLYETENDEFKVVIPTCKQDFIKEGQNQHNCVGGSYFDKMLKGECVVVFLRKKENLRESFCTVEFAPDGRVKQNRIKYNREAPEEAQKFINDLSKKVKETKAKQDYEAQKLIEKLNCKVAAV